MKTIELRELICCISNFEDYILTMIESKISKAPEVYFEDYGNLVKKNFNVNNFYCTSEGIIIYFQQYSIAPYSSGIREFLFPYSTCVINPKYLCARC